MSVIGVMRGAVSCNVLCYKIVVRCADDASFDENGKEICSFARFFCFVLRCDNANNAKFLLLFLEARKGQKKRCWETVLRFLGWFF